MCTSCMTERIALLEAVVEAARCIRHWHDPLNGGGMVVSSDHVRKLIGVSRGVRRWLGKVVIGTAVFRRRSNLDRKAPL